MGLKEVLDDIKDMYGLFIRKKYYEILKQASENMENCEEVPDVPILMGFLRNEFKQYIQKRLEEINHSDISDKLVSDYIATFYRETLTNSSYIVGNKVDEKLKELVECDLVGSGSRTLCGIKHSNGPIQCPKPLYENCLNLSKSKESKKKKVGLDRKVL